MEDYKKQEKSAPHEEVYNMAVLFVVDEKDNVAVALEDLQAGPVVFSGAARGTLQLLEEIPRGHKAALRDIASGADVMKHGHPVAIATAAICAGQWVHSHNVRSASDAVSKENRS